MKFTFFLFLNKYFAIITSFVHFCKHNCSFFLLFLNPKHEYKNTKHMHKIKFKVENKWFIVKNMKIYKSNENEKYKCV